LAIVVDAAAGGALVLAVFVVGRFLLPRDSGIKRSSNTCSRRAKDLFRLFNPLAARGTSLIHLSSSDVAGLGDAEKTLGKLDTDLPTVAFHAPGSVSMRRTAPRQC
jgi:hypothetical protein